MSSKIIPIDYINNLGRAEITELLIPARDEEETEALRKRYFDSFNMKAYGGNISDYKLKVHEIEGVGAVKVTPVWNGGGTVLLTILDSDFLLSRLGDLYPVDTPEGKAKAIEAFFPYVESLRSSVQKDACLDQLSRTFNIRLEAVRKDFHNRRNAENGRIKYREPDPTQHKTEEKNLRLTAELRSVLAIVADLNRFRTMRSQLTENDFEDPYAKELYIILEECFSQNSL